MSRLIAFLLLSILSLQTFAKELDWLELRRLKIKREKGHITGFHKNKKLQGLLKKKWTVTGLPLQITPSKKIKRFFLVPYVPTCAHIPPPPANQIIYVQLKKEIPFSADPIRVKGLLKIKHQKRFGYESFFELSNGVIIN